MSTEGADITSRMLQAGVENLVDASYGAMYAAGWWQFMGKDIREYPQPIIDLWIGSKLALAHSEISEGLEGMRKRLRDDKLPHHEMLTVEIADAILRLTDLAGGLGLPLGEALVEKMNFNASRADHKPENRAKPGGKSI